MSFGCADQVELHIIDGVWLLFATKGYTPKIDQTGLDTYPPAQGGFVHSLYETGCVLETHKYSFSDRLLYLFRTHCFSVVSNVLCATYVNTLDHNLHVSFGF